MKKTHLFILYAVIIAFILGVIYYRESRHLVGPNKRTTVNNFESCAAAGNPILESYPARCITPDGYSFTQVTSDSNPPTSTPATNDNQVKNDLITVDSPHNDELIHSPLVISGQARGSWYFEASFPVKLEDANGKILAQAPAMAQGEWMTDNFVPFSLTLSFTKPTTSTGKLILQKDKPSGEPENDKEIVVPIRFE